MVGVFLGMLIGIYFYTAGYATHAEAEIIALLFAIWFTLYVNRK